jgi:tRNA (cytidine/uridine-2'-O-)-methyltransferase
MGQGLPAALPLARRLPRGAPTARRHLFTARAARPFWDAKFQPADHLVFGSEPDGLPKRLVEAFPDETVGIPMLPHRRSMNLSTAVGIATYEALRQITRP